MTVATGGCAGPQRSWPRWRQQCKFPPPRPRVPRDTPDAGQAVLFPVAQVPPTVKVSLDNRQVDPQATRDAVLPQPIACPCDGGGVVGGGRSWGGERDGGGVRGGDGEWGIGEEEAGERGAGQDLGGQSGRLEDGSRARERARAVAACAGGQGEQGGGGTHCARCRAEAAPPAPPVHPPRRSLSRQQGNRAARARPPRRPAPP